MDRRELLKKLALGGVTIVGGTSLLTGAALAAKPDGKGGRPGTDPGGETGPQPLAGGPATVEFLTYKGGRGAKARFRVPEPPSTPYFHGWQAISLDNMSWEGIALEYEEDARNVAGTDTYTSYLDVKAAFPSTRDKTGSFSFSYWHGPSNEGASGVYTDATRYQMTVFVVDGVIPPDSFEVVPASP